MNSIFSSLGSKENKLEVINKDSKNLIAGDKSEYAESIFEDENVLIILRGYVLYEEIDYDLNIAKQILDLYKLKGSILFEKFSGAFNVIIFEKKNRN